MANTNGICGLPMSTIKSFWRDMPNADQFKPLIQLSGAPTAEFANLPHIEKLIVDEQDRQVANLIFGTQALGRIYAAPPDVPPVRVTVLCTAFTSTMKDVTFLADAAKTGIEILPSTGAEVEVPVRRLYRASPAVVDRTKLIGPGQ